MAFDSTKGTASLRIRLCVISCGGVAGVTGFTIYHNVVAASENVLSLGQTVFRDCPATPQHARKHTVVLIW